MQSEIKNTYAIGGYAGLQTLKTDLYTYENAKKTRYVDNMVDNVDKRVWITHTVHVNNRSFRIGFLRGKSRFRKWNMQEFLPALAVKMRRSTGGIIVFWVYCT